MGLHHLIEEFADRSRRCETSAELFALTEAAARDLGFQRFALVHGLCFRRPDRRLIRIENYADWAEVFVGRKYYLDDPVLIAAQRSSAAFLWSELAKLLPMTERQKAILLHAAAHGLRTGFTLPIGVMGEPHGSCSFGQSDPGAPSSWRCRAAALIGAELFREARRLHGFPARAKCVPRLSRRKLECLRYIAIGKTDGEIARILGLSMPTVRTYMTLLRKDFDVVSRSQLAVEALRFGLISYDDAIPAP